MKGKRIDINKMIIEEWRELGFYYDLDSRIEVNQWRFYGSKTGLRKFVKLLEDYTNNPINAEVFEHNHYGPYRYLKIITLDDQAIINDRAIGGTIDDLKKLKSIISEKIKSSQPGQTFNIDKDYGEDNTVTAKFFVMADDFEPVSMDELIMSDRQKIVNQNNKK